jgi:hypothetical protein
MVKWREAKGENATEFNLRESISDLIAIFLQGKANFARQIQNRQATLITCFISQQWCALMMNKRSHSFFLIEID